MMCIYKELTSLQGENSFVFWYEQQFYSQQCGSISNCALDPAPSLGSSQVVNKTQKLLWVEKPNCPIQWHLPRTCGTLCANKLKMAWVSLWDAGQVQPTLSYAPHRVCLSVHSPLSRSALWKKISQISPPTTLWFTLLSSLRGDKSGLLSVELTWAIKAAGHGNIFLPGVGIQSRVMVELVWRQDWLLDLCQSNPWKGLGFIPKSWRSCSNHCPLHLFSQVYRRCI